MKIEELHQPIPEERLSQKIVKGKPIDYLASADLCELLDERVRRGNWSWKVKEIKQVGNRLALVGGLTIYAEEGEITRESLAKTNLEGNDEAAAKAEEEALSLCCAKFGLGRDLWERREEG